MNFIPLKKLPDLLITPDFVTTSELKTIPIDPVPGSLARNCTLNVRLYIEENTGSAEFGWAVSSLGNVLIRFIGHCVVKQASGDLVCVTPPECTYFDEMAFIPDNSIAPVTINSERLPKMTLPLINHPVALEFAELESISTLVRNRYPSRSSLDDKRSSVALTAEDSEVMTDVAVRLRQLMPELHVLVAKTYDRNQYCFCNSGKKYKKCCKNKMERRLRKHVSVPVRS